MYLFARSGGAWAQETYLKASNSEAGDRFGGSVALSETTLVVAAPQEASSATGIGGDQADNGAMGSGAVYVLERPPTATATLRTAGSNSSSYTATPPVLGQTWTGTVDLTTTGHALALVLGFVAPTTLPLPSGEFLLVGPAFPSGEILGLPVQAGPTALFSVPLPDDSSLYGIEVFTQAVHFGVVQPFALSNAVDLVLGV